MVPQPAVECQRAVRTADNKRMDEAEFGGAKRDRTADLLVANEALSQLSYSPTRREQLRIILAVHRGNALRRAWVPGGDSCFLHRTFEAVKEGIQMGIGNLTLRHRG